MAGSLVHIGSQVAGGSDATFTITGIDSTYDVYLMLYFFSLFFNNLEILLLLNRLLQHQRPVPILMPMRSKS